MSRRRLKIPPNLLAHVPSSNQRKIPYHEVEMRQSYPFTKQLYGPRGATQPPIHDFAHNVEALNFFSNRRTKMAYRRRGRMPRRRLRRRRRGGIGRKRRITSLWPRTRLVKFRCVTSYAGTTGAGALVEVAFKANSLNDPFGTAGAQLPLGLDQWAAMYQRYAVVGSKCYVKAHAGTVTGAMTYGVSLLRSNSALSDYEYHLEQPLVRSKMLTADVDHSAVGMTYGAKRFWHFRKFMDAEEQQATFSTTPGDPTDLCYYVMWFQDVGKSEAVLMEAIVTIEYTVLLFDPIVPARSSL